METNRTRLGRRASFPFPFDSLSRRSSPQFQSRNLIADQTWGNLPERGLPLEQKLAPYAWEYMGRVIRTAENLYSVSYVSKVGKRGTTGISSG